MEASMKLTPLLAAVIVLPSLMVAQDWKPLFNGKNLDGWEVRGECTWTVLPDGMLLGQRSQAKPDDPFDAWPATREQYEKWLYRQAWLYTVGSYDEFDLHVEYIMPPKANSGVSIRDLSRAHYAIGEPDSARPDLAGAVKSTPAHIGYEIQIIDGSAPEKYPTGSIYTFVAAPATLQHDGEWNSMDIESRRSSIRVKVNGTLAAEYAGDPARSKVGPIGLQLHDQFTFALFRNIRIREISAAVSK
jgi:hypothetical protein